MNVVRKIVDPSPSKRWLWVMAELFWLYSNYATEGLNDSTENKLALIISKRDYKELFFLRKKKERKRQC